LIPTLQITVALRFAVPRIRLHGCDAVPRRQQKAWLESHRSAISADTIHQCWGGGVRSNTFLLVNGRFLNSPTNSRPSAIGQSSPFADLGNDRFMSFHLSEY
jgi:hypothetical protein